MGIFSFLTSSSKTENKVESIFELFEMDFDSVPDSNFKKEGTEINASGDEIEDYVTRFSVKELGLFNKLTIKVFKNGCKNFLFSSDNFNKNDFNNLKKLVDNLFSYYGLDSSKGGKFSNNDKQELLEGFWIGRSYTDEKHEPNLMISYDDEDGLGLTIWKTK
ncbi:hypothetical protein [Tenacibaculum piscium]|uniref:hypothetical protein n=1 Tax=Tenacibaculum piscium TaxID=1458515 RepID=UPI0007392F28|nr:hypothetical protein [Tenacibaculum piscium]ALU74315.1 hypothetical protein AUW17_03100 [Tenacibaculum dicentrarchi]